MRHCAFVRQWANISGWKAVGPCCAKCSETLSPLISQRPVHVPTGPLVWEELVRKGADVGEHGLPTFSMSWKRENSEERVSKLSKENRAPLMEILPACGQHCKLTKNPVFGASTCWESQLLSYPRLKQWRNAEEAAAFPGEKTGPSLSQSALIKIPMLAPGSLFSSPKSD